MTTEHDRPRPVRLLLAIGVGLAVATFAGWAFGLEWPSALLIALGLVAVFGLRQVPATNPDESWPAPPEAGSDQGVRREVTRLSWSLQGHESRVERPSLNRLRTVADRRLGALGFSLDDPADAAACRDLLGPLGHRVLTADPRSLITFDEFAGALDMVEKLGERGGR